MLSFCAVQVRFISIATFEDLVVQSDASGPIFNGIVRKLFPAGIRAVSCCAHRATYFQMTSPTTCICVAATPPKC